jgi:hypothetical protein
MMSDTDSGSNRTGRVAGRYTVHGLAKIGDFGAGKDGVLSEAQAEAKITELYDRLEMVDDNGGAMRIADLNDDDKNGFVAAIYAYLALNTGSSNADDGFGADVGSGTSLEWQYHSIPGAAVRQIFGVTTYRFMRRRATHIHDTLKVLYERGRGPHSDVYPKAVEFCDVMDVVAAKRGLSEYPLYAFVGAEYVARTPPKIRAAVFEAAASTLSTRTNTRESARTATMHAHENMRNA